MLISGSLPLAFNVDSDRNGDPVVTYTGRETEFLAPGSTDERLEWVRQSYMRFIDKVSELDALKAPLELN